MQASVPSVIENVRVAEINQGNNPFRILSLRALPDGHVSEMKNVIHKQNEKTKDLQELAADEEGESDEEYEPQTILNERLRRNKMQYLVQWRGFKKSEATWEPEAHIQSCSDIIKAWQEKIMQSMSKSSNNKEAASKKRGRPP